MTKLLNRFANWYQFDPTDIVTVIYGLCVMGIVNGVNMNLPFTIGVIVSLVSVLKSGRLNLLLINAFMLILNIYNIITLGV